MPARSSPSGGTPPLKKRAPKLQRVRISRGITKTKAKEIAKALAP